MFHTNHSVRKILSVIRGSAVCVGLIVPAIVAAGPRHYGYYATVDAASGDYEREVADHSNVAWIVNFQDPQKVKEKILEADCLNMRSIVDLASILFYGQNLNGNWQENWNNMATELAPLIDRIAAFYPIDEPFDHVNEQELIKAIQAIKARFPNTPVAVIYDGRPGLVGRMPALAYYDWVGADCYTIVGYTCGDYGGMLQSIKSNIDHNKQKMFLVPQLFQVLADSYGNPYDIMFEINRQKYEMEKQYRLSVEFLEEDAKADRPLVVGVFPFLWQGRGVLPALRDRYVALGKGIVANSGLPMTGCGAAKVMSVVTEILDQ